MESEIDRRREVAQNTDPRRQRGQGLRREQARLENHMERLVSAYQEGLVTLVQLCAFLVAEPPDSSSSARRVYHGWASRYPRA